MATVIGGFVGKYLLNKLASFTEENIVMITGVKDDLKEMEGRMRHIETFLTDAENRQITDKLVHNWLNELKDVMYDADDMIDLWRYKNQPITTEELSSSSNSPTCSLFPLLSCFRTIPARHEMAMQVRSLNTRLERIFNDMSILNLHHIKSEIHPVTRLDPGLSSPIIRTDVVGNEIEDGANQLVRLIAMHSKMNFDVVAITGMGGIGKTTLAQMIYNNVAVVNRFKVRIWLSISQSYSPIQLIREAIRNAGGNPGDAERESELLPILASVISGKSFFLVLDDMWNPDVWVNLFQNPLKAYATRGFILVTTRDRSVAMGMGAKEIHQKTVLSTESGWELLCKRAYLTDAEDIRNLRGVGTKIIEKCGGLPLAIEAIAGILTTKDRTRKEWENVQQNNAWSISGLPKEIDRALYLSYEDLSSHLKQCFLYCSLYPPNRIIFRVDLVRCWISEGFVEERRNQVIENTAEEYYHELIRRHLLEPDPLVTDHAQCRIHELFRSLGQYLSRAESFSADQLLPGSVAISQLRRLSIEETSENFCISVQTKPMALRTFMIFNCLSRIENGMFVRFKKLRVLRINGKGFNSIPEIIGDMIHLRLLDLEGTSISNIPECIASLTNLLFLNLAHCTRLEKLPRAIIKLCNLRHLIIDGTPLTSVPKGLGKLQKLIEIFGFQVIGDGGRGEDSNGWDLRELEGLSQLKRIWISKLERARARDVSNVLANKIHLKQLFLFFSEVHGNSGLQEESENENSKVILEKLHPPPCIEELRIINYRNRKLPRWMSSSSSLGELLSNLLYLHLFGWLICTDLPPLGLLPNLKYLKVQGANAIVKISFDFLGFKGWNGPSLPIAFRRLEYLIFEDMPEWEEWVVPVPGFEGEISPSWQLMPHLKQLGILQCPKLRGLPEGLQHLTAVRELIVREAHSIRSIQDFQFECEFLEIKNNQCLEIVANLPRLKKLAVSCNPNLRHVSQLVSLTKLILVDYNTDCLPEWAIRFMETNGRVVFQ